VSQAVVRHFCINYDPSSETDFVYPRLADTFQTLGASATTSGSSTTVSEGSTSNEFANGLGVGDILYNPVTGDTVSVTARASSASITVSSAVNWATHKNIRVRKFSSGQTVNDGWIGCADLTDKVVRLTVATIASASATFTIESKMPHMAPVTLLTPANFTAITTSATTGVSSFADIAIPETAMAVRVGVKVATDGTDVVSAALMGVKRST
jgi:hypothetical protein